jgi:hypothetical protein
MPDHLDADAIVVELNDCRQRGLDWLDHKTTKQNPVKRPQLGRLANEYADSSSLGSIGPIGQIQSLLRAGITELARRGRVGDADLVQDLFFGESWTARSRRLAYC